MTRASVLLLLAALVLAFSFSTTLGLEKSSPTWVWTKKNPKPVWWKWENDTKKPMRGGYIHKVASAYIGLMNPNHWPVNDWISINDMYEGLVYIQGDYQPSFLWLAESVKYPNPTTCIMTLRKGVKFHDGSDFNADTVKYLHEYIKDKNNGCWTRAYLEPVETIEVLDKYTVKWTFKRPWSGFMGMMATVPGHMISRKALEGDVAMKEMEKAEKRLKRARDQLADAEKNAAQAAKGGAEAAKTAEALEAAKKDVSALEQQIAALEPKAREAKNVDQNPVGSAAYMLEEARPGNYLKMKRNPNWWFGQSIGHPELPEADGVIVFVIPDEMVRLANLRAGKLDYIYILSPTQYVSLKGDPKFTIASRLLNSVVGLAFNNAKGPCQDIRVRKAISHAINRKALLEGLMLGRGKVASCMFPEDHWCHNPNLKPIKFDPELSKRLLAEAGYKGGLTLTGFMGNTPTSVNLSEAIKSMLKNVGITWKVDALDTVAASDRSKNLEYDLSGSAWGYIKEPDMIATGLYHPDGGFNHGRNKNDKVIALIEAGKTELDIEKRKKIYREMEKIVYENYMDAWLWWPIIDTARSNRLLGYDVKMHVIGGEAYRFSHPGFFKDGRRE
jgi:peptide/nickel transport system substrate-binding protein